MIIALTVVAFVWFVIAHRLAVRQRADAYVRELIARMNAVPPIIVKITVDLREFHRGAENVARAMNDFRSAFMTQFMAAVTRGIRDDD